MHQPPAKYLVLIDSSGAMTARLFDAKGVPVAEFDASSEEVAVMTAGLTPAKGANGEAWTKALAGHNEQERRDAEVYTLDV
jgi:hypothetical protein